MSEKDILKLREKIKQHIAKKLSCAEIQSGKKYF